MKKVKSIFILFFLVIFTCTGCSSFVDPTTRAQNLARNGKFEEAVKVLEQEYKARPNSVPIKSLLAQAYSDYGLALCQDQSKPPKVKYPLAKEQFAMALALNPYLKDAKEMHEMIEKIQASFRANKID